MTEGLSSASAASSEPPPGGGGRQPDARDLHGQLPAGLRRFLERGQERLRVGVRDRVPRPEEHRDAHRFRHGGRDELGVVSQRFREKASLLGGQRLLHGDAEHHLHAVVHFLVPQISDRAGLLGDDGPTSLLVATVRTSAFSSSW